MYTISAMYQMIDCNASTVAKAPNIKWDQIDQIWSTLVHIQ